MQSSETLGTIINDTSRIVAAAIESPARALVFPADGGDPKPVTNLGWLLRHNGDVRHYLQGPAFTVCGWRYEYRRVGGYLSQNRHDPVLIAWLADGRAYACAFADPGVLLDWLDRPSFRGLVCTFDYRPSVSNTCTIGGADWRELKGALDAYYERGRRERRLAATESI